MKKLANNLSLIAASFLASASVVFAESDKDFFEAAEGITFPTDETATGATAPVPQAAEGAAEQAQHGANFVDSAKEFFTNLVGNIQHGTQGFTDQLQNFGNLIGEKLNVVTGGNPLISKIAVALVLVLISIVIIVVLVLIAKKFVHKTQANPFQSQPFGPTDENDFEPIDDNNNVQDDGSFAPADNDDGTVDIGNQTNQKVTSEEQKTLSSPTDISGAMKNFLNVTE